MMLSVQRQSSAAPWPDDMGVSPGRLQLGTTANVAPGGIRRPSNLCRRITTLNLGAIASSTRRAVIRSGHQRPASSSSAGLDVSPPDR
jgi:hypothetical protein